MEFFITGLISGLFGAIPFNLSNERWPMISLASGIACAIFGAIAGYLLLPELTGPFWGMSIFIFALVSACVSLCIDSLIDSYNIERRIVVGMTLFFLVVPIIGSLRGCTAVRSGDYRAFVQENVEQREWSTDMEPVDTAHIRMVSKKQAMWSAKKILGDADGSLGSKYQIGNLTIQKVGEGLVWVAPLEFQGFRSWTRFDTTPGYVKVSAENPSKPAELVTGYKFRYLQSAFFGDNLERLLYQNGYQFTGSTDYTFELDDDGKPYFVVTGYVPTIGYSGDDVVNIALVDPETGEVTEYSIEEAPAWVDRIIPKGFAFERLNWYGKYVDGWVNSWWGEDNVRIPTDADNVSDLWLTWGSDGNAYWFTGMTSSKATDDSLVGFVLMNSRTGETLEYKLAGADEEGVLKAVNDAVSNYSNYEGTQPVLYNIYGELTWVVPVISGDGIFQRLALVRAENAQVILGKNKKEALAEYRRVLQSSGNTVAPSSQTKTSAANGIIDRIRCIAESGNTTCYLTLLGSEHQQIFTGTLLVSAELVIAQHGDRVAIEYTDTSEGLVPMTSFDFLGFDLKSTEKQQEVDARAKQEERKAVRKRSASDIRANLRNMSDEELLEKHGGAEENK